MCLFVSFLSRLKRALMSLYGITGLDPQRSFSIFGVYTVHAHVHCTLYSTYMHCNVTLLIVYSVLLYHLPTYLPRSSLFHAFPPNSAQWRGFHGISRGV